jgi:dihydropteroate synthase
MGIINITPDSFYEGHLNKKDSDLLLMAEKMIIDGASILDIGGQSTKPGSKRIDADEELNRVIPIIKSIRKNSKPLTQLINKTATTDKAAASHFELFFICMFCLPCPRIFNNKIIDV